jgi:hypothetical protein
MITEDYIKIPKDFKSLHELKELVNNYELVTRLSNALDGYQRMYLDSFMMTRDQVLQHIPETQHNLYEIQIRGKNRDIMQDYVGKEDAKKLKIKVDRQGYRRLSLDEALNKIKCHKDSRLFMVDVDKKVIDTCFWYDTSNEKPTEKRRRKIGEYDLDSCDKYTGDGLKYTGKMDFNLNPETKELVLKVHYEYGASQAVGGVWINGRNGYLSGETYNKYTINGYDIYHFCTRTNKFTGYIGNKEDKHREWLDTRKRY